MAPPLRRSLFSLPPALRTSLYQQQQQQQSRSFSASAPRKSPLADALLYCPTLLLDTLHTGKALLTSNLYIDPNLKTGLPWHTAIPLSAILVRTLLVYHLSALPARKAAITRTNLAPLSHAKFRSEYAAYRSSLAESHIAAAEAGERVSRPRLLLSNLKMNIMRPWMSLRTSHKMGKEFGAPVWSWWRSPINLGVLIAMTEAVRVKCGAREGLLNLLIKPIDRHVDPETARRAAMTPDEIMVERLEAAYAAKQAGRTPPENIVQGEEMLLGEEESITSSWGDLSSSDQLPALNTNIYASKLDPSLKTEGMAWFPDLTVADSTLLLPLALSGTMALTVLLRPRTNPPPLVRKKSEKKPERKPERKPTKQQDETIPDDPVAALAALPAPKSPMDYLSTSQKFGLSLSLLFFFAAMKLPVAVLLYLTTSLGFGWLQSRWLDLRYPLPEVVTACRRPVRVKVRKEFRDA